MYKDFRHFCQTKHPSPAAVDMDEPGWRHIVNLFTQEAAYAHGSKPGDASLSNVNHALHALRALIEKEQMPSIALPRLACA